MSLSLCYYLNFDQCLYYCIKKSCAHKTGKREQIIFFLIKKKEKNEWMSGRRTIHDTESPIRFFFKRFNAYILLFI